MKDIQHIRTRYQLVKEWRETLARLDNILKRSFKLGIMIGKDGGKYEAE